ncbi:MAG: hypothetical protein MJ231_03860 [bacterium]|nr:hypothetical protein [bacterium]
MGMSASQARLLTLTSRMHDIEFRAQSIESQKIALATQQDELYENYCAALEATKIKVAFNNNGASGYNYVDACFNTVCTFQPDRCKQQYALRNNDTGLIVVPKNVKEAYEQFPNDKYAFAFAAMGLNYEDGHEVGLKNAQGYYGVGKTYDGDKGDCYMTKVEQEVFDKFASSDKSISDLYQAVIDSESASDPERFDALNKFREKLYLKYGTEIFNALKEEDGNESFQDKDISEVKQEINYYASLFDAIVEAGGCEEVPSEYQAGDEAEDWFKNRLDSGRATLLEFNDRGTKKGWMDTSVNSTINPNFLIETDDDEKAKKAEVEYEHEVKVLDRKDKQYDNELSKLETERTAIKTEMDSIKQVKDDNIDRTFGIFG